MDKKLFRSLILLITYTVLLLLVVTQLDRLFHGMGAVIGACKPLFIGFAIAFVLRRPCEFFARQYGKVFTGRGEKLARPLAVASSYVVLIGLIVALFALVIPQLVSSIQLFVSNLNTYAANLQAIYDWVVGFLDLDLLANVNLSGISSSLQKVLEGAVNAVTTAVPRIFTITANLVSALVTLFLSVIFSIYMLSSNRRLGSQGRRVVLAYLPPRAADVVLRVVGITSETFTNYVSGQLIEAAILGGLCFVGMIFFKFDYAPLISVIIAVGALIPVAGAYIAAAVACLLLVMIEPMQAVFFLIFLLVLQQLEGNLIYPRVVGSSIGLPGLWVLAAISVGGGLFGFLGMLVGVPVAAVLYTLLQTDVRKRLKGKEEPEEEEVK